ncbi:MAG: MBL fold metallo-hydrolase [Patescibacteria group bacterium]
MNQTASYKDATITALGHAGFIVDYPERKLRWAFDPFDITGHDPVDYIFISHPHYDHCDPQSIKKLLGPRTRIIAPACCKKELEEFADNLEIIDDKEKHEDKQIIYWTTPAYNIDKFRTPSEVFHPKELGGVGWIVEVDRTRFYHAGDTDNIPEMANLKKIDVAFLPISGTFVMTCDEAVAAAKVIEPKAAVPMHYGKLLGSVVEATRFQNLLREDIPVIIVTDVHHDH